MSEKRPDKALRRMVAELAAASAEDVEAILGELDPRGRRRVEALLAEYRGEVIQLSTAIPVKSTELIAIQGLSPWLAARLDRRTQTAIPRPGSLGEIRASDARELGLHYSMTQTALEALRSAAAAMQQSPAEGRTPAPWTGPVRKALLGRREAR